ncbi:MAG: nucleoside hydrolase [Armatimonadetes bacterium]|nr:nucleoside hydrolase [Armatimonadota bacterium]
MPDERIPILLDTDIGSDIDDAVCLAYLLCQPRCQLLGITTVTGEPDRRAMLADAICRAAGRPDVPIHAGAAQPLLAPVRQPHAPQASILDRWSHRQKFPPNTAVDFLRGAIRHQPGEVILLSLGPFTNVGLLFALDPEIPSLLRGYVSMGGVFTRRIAGAPLREWNVLNDPHAAAIAYRTKAPHHLSVGLDVTLRCRLPADECRRRFQGGPLDVVGSAAEVWFQGRSQVTFHDPLAGVLIFHPEICQYEDGLVDVELMNENDLGMTRWHPAPEEKPHRVAVDVNPEAFFAEYFSVFGR